MSDDVTPPAAPSEEPSIIVRRIHRRDLNKVWEFLKLCFRVVNRETLEYQRPRSKKRFLEVYEEEGVEQLLFEVPSDDGTEIVAYAECAFEITGADNWMNESFFTRRDMRPMFVEELAVHPGYQGRGVGSFALEQLEHLARVRGCTHLVLEVAENNKNALKFYRGRHFTKLDAAVFMAKRVSNDEELLPPRPLSHRAAEPAGAVKKATKRPSARPKKREATAAGAKKKA